MIRDDLERKTFACHETTSVTTPQPRDARGRFAKRVLQHCAGALILMHKTDTQGDMQQVAERLELYSRHDLRMDSPVYETWEQMIEAHDG